MIGPIEQGNSGVNYRTVAMIGNVDSERATDTAAAGMSGKCVRLPTGVLPQRLTVGI